MKASKKPLSGNDHTARPYDNDLVGDDFLGESKLDDNGKAEVVTNLDPAEFADSPLETCPELYFPLYNQDWVIFESKVFKNVDFLGKDDVSHEHRSASRDLGTFEV